MLSKSKYCSFVQCPKNLWLGVNKPELAVKDPSAESRMEEGNAIGDLAMQLFGDFVEVTAYKEDGKLDLSKMIGRTKALIMHEQPVICEASFSYNGDYCAVDILKREGDGYAIYEVKSSTGAKDVYITDISYQKYILEHCGINVTGTYLVLINKDYVFDGNLKLDELFKIVDVSSEVEEKIGTVEANIREAKYAHSKPDFISKLQISLKECYETEYWLELMNRAEILPDVSAFIHSCGVIRKMLISSINTAKQNIDK